MFWVAPQTDLLYIIIALAAMSHSPSFETSSDTRITFSSDSYDVNPSDVSDFNPSSSTAELLPASTSAQITSPAPPRSFLPHSSRIPYFFRLAFWIWLVLSGVTMLVSSILFLTSNCPQTNNSESASHSSISQSQCIYGDSLSRETAIAVFVFLGLFVGVPILVISFILPCVVGYIYTYSRPEASPAYQLPIPIVSPSRLVVEDEESSLFATKM